MDWVWLPSLFLVLLFSWRGASRVFFDIDLLFNLFFFIMNFILFGYTFVFFMASFYVIFAHFSFILVLVYLELLAMCTSMFLVLYGYYYDSFYFEFFSVSLMAVVGCESSLAISFLILLNRLGSRLTGADLNKLKGLFL